MVNKLVTKPKFCKYVPPKVDSRVVGSMPRESWVRLQDKEKHEEIPSSGLGCGN